jgi:hypothetical protein
LKEVLLEPEIPSGDIAKDYMNARTVQSWSCEIDESENEMVLPEQANGNAFGKVKNRKKFYDVSGIDKKWLDERASSGGSIMKVTNAIITTDTLEVSDTANVIIEEIAEERRRLAAQSGVLKTKVVRVFGTRADGTLVSPSASVEQLRDDIFLDGSCLSSLYKACSKGKLTVTEGMFEDITITADPTKTTKEIMEMQATAKVSRAGYDLVMFCQPGGTGSWVAYAYLNSWNSYYNDKWCQSASVQMHEVGHNIVSHSAEIDILTPTTTPLILSSFLMIALSGSGPCW